MLRLRCVIYPKKNLSYDMQNKKLFEKYMIYNKTTRRALDSPVFPQSGRSLNESEIHDVCHWIFGEKAG